MRSCTITSRSLLLLLFLPLLFEGGLRAQNETGSPFSVKGLGELGPPNYARNFGMGGVGMALPGHTGVDPSNPGHYGNLEEPTFEMGVLHQRIGVRNGELKESKKNTGLRNIAFGFPGSDRWTLTMGIEPMAQRDYAVRDSGLQKDGIGTYHRAYGGDGRIQRAYIGNGYNVIQRGDSLVLGIGFHAAYLFGELSDRRNIAFESSSNFNTRVERGISVGGFAFDAGLHFQKRFDLHPREGTESGEMVPLRLMAGLTFDIPRELGIEKDRLVETYTNSGGVKDTIELVDGQKLPFRLPLGYGGGFALEYDERLKASFEFRKRNWGDVQGEAASLLFSGKNRDRVVGRFGLEYTPQLEYKRSSSYFAYWDYRLGARAIKEYYSYNGREVRDLGISFGLGVPLVRSSSYSSINIGAEWSRRGPQGGGTDLLRERAWKFYIGVSLSPHRADQWFREPKIR